MAADFEKAKKTARETLEGFQVTSAPIDPEVLAEAMGIDVVYAHFQPEMSDSISGFIQFEPLRIVVNSKIAPNRKTFTIAHELGHYLMHKEYAQSARYQILPRSNNHIYGKPAEEQEADCFAANLLVPDKILRRYQNIASTYELSRIFLVSEEVIKNRLRRFG